DLHLTLTQARHILLRPTEQLSMPAIMAQLSRWRQQVVAGQADFAALAKAHSRDGSAAQGGDLGWAQPGQFVPEFEQAMNTLAVGEVSQPVVSRFGVHLIQVVQRRQEPMTEAQQREWARQQLREQRAPLVYNAWATEVRAKAYVKVLAPDL
ncbi:MAG: peptidylprolyl isomerase, partial [Burkholderiaceae bacterium]